jgi:Winged helix DNA-binding domain
VTGALMADSLTWEAVGVRRLERNLLAAPSINGRPADIAAAMCGTHAQVMAAAEISIAMRMERGTRADVQAALWTDHSAIKTYGLRGTVHVFAARDLEMWTGALAAVPLRIGSYPEGVRLTSVESGRIVEAMAAALEKAELTADELEDEIVARVGAWAAERSVAAFQSAWPRWRLALYDAVAQGVLCFGANQGSKVTWTSVRRLIPGFKPMEREEAVQRLLRAYLYAYGPSTPEWFARWLAAPKSWADGAFSSLGDGIAEVEVEGTRAWILVDDRGFPDGPSQGVRLLPYFDAYTIAWQPREVMFPGRAAERALASGQAGTVPVLLVDGVVAGVWRQRTTAKKLAIMVEPFGDVRSSERDELDVQVARLGEIWGLPAELTFDQVTAGHRSPVQPEAGR